MSGYSSQLRWSWLVWSLVLSGAPSWSADPPNAPRVATRPDAASRAGTPEQSPPGDDALDDLTIVLTNWTRIGAAIRTLQGEFQRHEFDDTRHVETVASGRICYEAGGRALYAIGSPPRTPLPASKRQRPNGKPYEVTAASPEVLYWVHGQFVRVHAPRPEYELFEVPVPFRTSAPVEALDSWDILWTTLGSLPRRAPGLLETSLPHIQQRYEWTLVGMDENHIVLTAKPRTAAEKRHMSELHVHLDADTYLTEATKVIDSTGTREVIHVFRNLRINAPQDPAQPDWAPDLARMTLLTAPPLAPPAALDE